MTASWLAPDACTLPSADQPFRVGEFDTLFERHLVRVERPDPTQATLILGGDDRLEANVRDLTERESQCCSFFAFEVARQPAQEGGSVLVRLDVQVPPARRPVLEALVDRALSARERGHRVG
jgi:hypothetical protein